MKLLLISLLVQTWFKGKRQSDPPIFVWNHETVEDDVMSLDKIHLNLFQEKYFLFTCLLFLLHISFWTSLNSASLSPDSVRSLFLLHLLLWFFSFCRLFGLPPWQEVVRDQSCEQVCSHASISSQHQTQRLYQHEQTEHVQWCPVVQLHSIVLRGFHDSKKINQCHCWVEGQLHHDTQDRGCFHTLDSL